MVADVIRSGASHRAQDTAGCRCYIPCQTERGTLDGPTYVRKFKQIESTDNGFGIAINQNIFLGSEACQGTSSRLPNETYTAQITVSDFSFMKKFHT